MPPSLVSLGALRTRPANCHLLHFLPHVPIPLLVERRASCRVLAERMVLRPHQSRAVAERPADALAVGPPVLLHLKRQIRLSERGPSQADEGGPSVSQVAGPGVR